MDISDAMARRRSIRRYVNIDVSDAQIETLLSGACLAPSAHNRQPWRFSVLRTDSAKEKLAGVMSAKLAEDRRRDGDAADEVAADVARSRARIVHAPVVILVSMSLIDMDTYTDNFRGHAERVMAIQSTAMAVQNLLLAATSLGLGACWMCAPLFCPTIIRSVLHLPGDWEPQALITVGVPANAGKLGKRFPMAKVVRYVEM